MCKTEVGHGWFKYTKNMPDALERPRSKLFRRIVIKDVQAAAKFKLSLGHGLPAARIYRTAQSRSGE
jgi:hypothetical protein